MKHFDDQAYQDVFEEAELMMKVKHKNVLESYQFGEALMHKISKDRKVPVIYLVMKLCQAENLYGII
jgi:serine/threonine protein kinase